MNKDLEAFQLLERYGARIDDDIMGTPIWWATHSTVETGNTDLIDYLVAKGYHAVLENLSSAECMVM